MKNIAQNLLHIFLVVLLVACSSDSKQLALLDGAESVMTSAPDSALTLLREIKSNKLNRADNARYALLLSQALDKNYIDVTDDSLINIAVEYYEHSNNNRYRGMAYFYKSRVLQNTGNYDPAISYSILAEEALANTDEYYMMALIYSFRGSIYKEQFRFYDTINHKKEAIKYFQKINHLLNIFYAHLSMVPIYMVLPQPQPDSALYEIEQAHNLALQLEDEELLYMVENKRASFYTHNKEYDKALAILHNAREQYPNHTLNADDYHLQARLYWGKGQCDSALYILDTFYAPLCQTHSDFETLHLFRSTLYEGMNDYAKALSSYKEYASYKTESGLFEQNNSINDLEKKYRTQQLEQKNQTLITSNTSLTVVAILAILLTVFFIFQYYQQRQLRITQYYQLQESARNNITEIQQKYDDIQQKLSTQESKIQVSYNALKERIDTLKTIIEFSNIYESNKNLFYKKCCSYINMCDNNNSFLKDIRLMASVYKTNFVDILQDRFPTLNDDEINFCCLVLLGFDMQHLRILCNHNHIQSTYAKRARIIKKINLTDNQNLQEFLQQI